VLLLSIRGETVAQIFEQLTFITGRIYHLFDVCLGHADQKEVLEMLDITLWLFCFDVFHILDQFFFFGRHSWLANSFAVASR